MKLSKKELNLFYSIWLPLLYGINLKNMFCPELPILDPNHFNPFIFQQLRIIREKIWDEPQLIDEFLADPGLCSFNVEERKIVLDIREHFIKKSFILIEHQKNYSLLMTNDDEPTRLFGVLGLSSSIKSAVRLPLPVLITTVLFPFRDKIVYDGIIEIHSERYSAEELASIQARFFDAKNKIGITETLNGQPVLPLNRKQNITRLEKKVKKMSSSRRRLKK
ncbi:MAG: hypothetical protein LBI10_04140 [Deltaproteobacteria bacterium]|jgi:hypothetical protein|nr:hypothetical protein [Deltaproteobacteria bacterium]